MPDKAIDLIDESASKVRICSLESPHELKKVEKQILKLKKEREATLPTKLVSGKQSKQARKANQDKANAKVAEINRKIKKLNKQKSLLSSSWCKDKATGQPAVTAKDIQKLISDWTGIPLAELAEEEIDKLLKLEERLHQRVIGQDEAVKAVAEAIRRGRAGLKDQKRPLGSFIFLGPTGVGKTELAKALAAIVFGNEDAMIRLDMSEYSERHATAKLTGSPPGYVGYEEGGQLTEKVRRKPYSVILLDEIEKAHPDVFNILLQILDDGRLTDAKGRIADFKNTLIIATSNIGSEKIQRATIGHIGFKDSRQTKKKKKDALRDELMRELKEIFRPEFLNRIDEIIIFDSLSQKEIKQIVDLLIKEVQRLLRGQNVTIELSLKTKNKIAKEGYDPAFGARPLKRYIQKEIENPLATLLLSGKFKSGDNIIVDAAKGKFEFMKAKANTVK